MNEYQSFLKNSNAGEKIKYYLKNNFKIKVNLEHDNPANININFVPYINYYDYNSDNFTTKEIKEIEQFEEMLHDLIIEDEVYQKLEKLFDNFINLPVKNENLIKLKSKVINVMISEYGVDWKKDIENKVKFKFDI